MRHELFSVTDCERQPSSRFHFGVGTVNRLHVPCGVHPRRHRQVMAVDKRKEKQPLS